MFRISIIFIFYFLTIQLFSQPHLPQLGKNSTEEVIAAMTSEEKVSMVMGLGLEDEAQAVISKMAAGVQGVTYAIPRLGIPSIILCDGPAGTRLMNIKGTDKNYFTAFPVATAMAATWNIELEQQLAKAMASEALGYNIDLQLAPSMNIQRNPLNGRNFEYFSEDPYLSGKLGAAFVIGMQSTGLGTSVKHFIANNQETNRWMCNSVVSQRALREIYLRGFEIAIKEGKPWTVMTSYNKVNGLFTAQNPELLQTILRNEWKYDGMVMTDWWSGDDAVAQMNAGNELIMPGSVKRGGIMWREELLKALKNKTLDEKILDRNIKPILELILKTNHFKNSFPATKPDVEAHAHFAREAASEAMVLLKNKENTLPFGRKIKTVALFGKTSYNSIAGGTGSGAINYKHAVSISEGLTNAGFSINKSVNDFYTHFIDSVMVNTKPTTITPINTYDTNVWRYPSASPIIWHSEIKVTDINKFAAKSDIAVVTLGRMAGEGTDRKENDFYLLSELEKTLINDVSVAFHAVNKKVVVILNISGVIETVSWRDKVDAIITAWQPGQEVGNAVADILKGTVNPSGKLPMTYSIKYADEPSAKSFPGEPKNNPVNSFYNEGIYVGYRYFDTFKVQTAYEFGFGLSYSNFEVSDLKLISNVFTDKITATVMVQNTGKRAGKEVVQLYLSAPNTEIEKPLQELKGFQKTNLLKPNESQQLTFTLDNRSLTSYWSGISAWVADKGDYEIRIGVSSNDIRQKATFNLPQRIIVEKCNNVLYPNLKLKEISSLTKN